MLRACVLDLKGSWDEHLLLVEFSYSNSYQASIQQRPLECEVGDYVFLKVMFKRGVTRFDKWGKLSSRYIGLLRYSRG